MAAEFGKDELLAQAILDLELKMKHEIRQNNAFLLSKIEKHYEQTDKKLTFLEAKMDALVREREDRQQPHSRGGRRTNYFATNNFSPNNANGRAQMFAADVRRPSGAGPPNIPNQQQHQYKVFGLGGTGNTQAIRQFKPHIEKPISDGHGHGGRYKQTLGTSKVQVASPSTIQNQWTTKAAGLYTDDEDSSDSSESQKSSAKQLVAKPQEDQLRVSPEQEQPSLETVENSDAKNLAAKSQKEFEDQVQKGTDREQSVMKFVDEGEDGTIVFEESMTTVTPGATISPVLGGFGRRRKI